MCAAAAALAVVGVGLHWPDPPAPAPDARIFIRWSPSVDDAQRVSAERDLGLVSPRHVEAQTWEYTPTLTNRDAIERIVKDQRVQDTHNVDRSRFLIRGVRDENILPRQLDRALESVHDDHRIWVTAAAVVFFFGLLLPMFQRFGDWIGASIQPVSIRQFRIYRVALGVALAGSIWATPFAIYPPRPVHAQRLESWFADWALFHWLAADSMRLAPLQTVAAVAALGFAAGIAARASLAVSAGAVTLLILGRLGLDSAHDWGLALITLLALIVVPWGRVARPGSAPSDAMWRGFAIWLPGFMLGLGFLAAAVAKLLTSGPAWITTGAVRYHFVQDAGSRVSDITSWIAVHPVAAVAVSAGAIIAESTLILCALSARMSRRLAGLVLGVGLLSGFYAFQGVFWYPWWMLLLSFLPWNSGRYAKAVLAPAAGRTIAIVASLQFLATAAIIEIEPFLSNFPMYSHTYDSPDAFNQQYRAAHQSTRDWVVDPSGCARAPRADDSGVTQAREAIATEFDFSSGQFVSKSMWFTMEGAELSPSTPIPPCPSR